MTDEVIHNPDTTEGGHDTEIFCSGQEEPRHIGKEIAELREYLGLNQSQLAKLSGLTPASISMIENDLRDPTIETLKKICTGLEVDAAYFFRDKKKVLSPLEVLNHRKLSDHDKAEIEKFAQFLQYCKSKAP